MSNVLTHNGIFTITSTKTGDHRTFKIRTQPLDSNFAPGKRVLYLLTGPNNTQDYKGFAFVDDNGIHLWKKSQTPQYQAFVRMLLNLTQFEAEGKCTVQAATTCRVCNRTLTTPESIESGIGPICEGRATEAINDRLEEKAEFAKLETEQEQKAFATKYKYRESLYAQNRLGSGPAEVYVSPLTGNAYSGD